MIRIYSNTGGIAATNGYLVADPDAGQAVIVDAPDHTTGELLGVAQQQGWEVVALWLTHGHFDHIADHAVVTGRFPSAKVLIHELDHAKLQDPAAQLRIFPVPLRIPPRSADALLDDGQVLRLGALEFTVIHTPGHAPGHVMFHCPAQRVLLGGDLIIGGAVGRTDLPDSDEAALVASIRRVMELPGDTKLLPGHGEPSTLEEERESNPYVRAALGLE